ncbi:hypothetical protein B566_EDAN011791 [Ephemera danica]|nr:hypothetical protein B566_EDAN011791 [Ephemera danica]
MVSSYSEIFSEDDYYVVSSITADTLDNQWRAKVQLGHNLVNFKADSGADVTAISMKDFEQLQPRPVCDHDLTKHSPPQYMYSQLSEPPPFTPCDLKKGCSVLPTESSQYPWKNVALDVAGKHGNHSKLPMSKRAPTVIPTKIRDCVHVKKSLQKVKHNVNDGAKDSAFKIGHRVWIKDQNREGVIVEKASKPRSFIVKTTQGYLRRNRRNLTRISAYTELSEEGEKDIVCNFKKVMVYQDHPYSTFRSWTAA